MKFRLPPVFLTTAFILLSEQAISCGFHQVLTDNCPTGERSYSAAAINDSDIDKGIIYKDKLWTKHASFSNLGNANINLKVCFNDDASTREVDTIKAILNAYESMRAKIGGFWYESRLRFSVRDESADKNVRLCSDSKNNHHIRVSLSSTENSSRLGIDSLNYNPSMKLNIINSSYVLHEFGHALGLRHETLHSKWAKCLKNDNFNYKKYAKDFNFGDQFEYKAGDTEAETNAKLDSEVKVVKQNIRALEKDLIANHFQTTKLDASSIMTYSIASKYFTKNLSGCSQRDNTKLSGDDKVLLLDSRVYGRLDDSQDG